MTNMLLSSLGLIIKKNVVTLYTINGGRDHLAELLRLSCHFLLNMKSMWIIWRRTKFLPAFGNLHRNLTVSSSQLRQNID